MNGDVFKWINHLLDIFFKTKVNGKRNDPFFQPFTQDSYYYAPTRYYNTEAYKFAGSILALAVQLGISAKGVEFVPSLYRLILDLEPFDINGKDLNFITDQPKFNSEALQTLKYNNLVNILSRNDCPCLKAFADGFRSKIPRKISKYLDFPI